MTSRHLVLILGGVGLAAWASGCGNPCLDDGFGKGECVFVPGAGDGTGDEGDDDDDDDDDDDTGDGDGVGDGDGDGEGDGDGGDDDDDDDGDGDGGDGDDGDDDDDDDDELCEDDDGDGFGNPDNCLPEDEADDDWVDNDDDCDDSNENAYPGAAEEEPDLCAEDEDDDGWGDDDPPDGVDKGSDCDDGEANIYPGAAEEEPDLCAKDEDDDGWGDDDPPDGVDPGTDCDDDNASTYPGAAEKQEDLCAKDEDDDEWGDQDPPDGVDPGADCDDDDEDVNPDEGDTSCLEPLELTVPKNYNIDSGDDVTLAAVGSGGSGAYDWDWTPSDTLDESDIAQPLASPETGTTYTVTLEDTVTDETIEETVTVHVLGEPSDLGECEVIRVGPDNADLEEQSWEHEDSNRRSCQLENSVSSALVCPIELYEAKVEGKMFVERLDNGGEETDDDWMGLVWGVRDDDNEFYLFSWKRESQQHAGCGNTFFSTGMRVKRIDRWSTDLSCDDLTGDFNTDDSELLMGPDDIGDGDEGWVTDAEYDFELQHDPDGSYIQITGDGLDVEIDIDDDEIESGKFGYFSFSQANSCWEDVITEADL